MCEIGGVPLQSFAMQDLGCDRNPLWVLTHLALKIYRRSEAPALIADGSRVAQN